MAKYIMGNRFITMEEVRVKAQKNFDYYYWVSLSCGRSGCAYEIMIANSNSRKANVSAKGRYDINIKLGADNAKGYKLTKAEIKTNGGRVGQLIADYESGKNYPVIYSISYDVEMKNGIEYRDAFDKLFTLAEFIEGLQSCGAIKEHHDSHNRGHNLDYAIQVTNKSWFEFVSEWSREYHRDEVNYLD